MAVDILNSTNCANGGNLGVAPCSIDPSIFRYLVAVPKGTIIASSNLTSTTVANTYINGLLASDTPGLRWQILPELSKFANKSEPYKTINKDGRMIPTQRTPYVWEWEFWNGSNAATKFIHSLMITKFNNGKGASFYDYFIIDDNGNWMGQGVNLNTSTAGLKAISLSTFLVYDWDPAKSDGADANVYKFMISLLNNSQLNENFSAITLSTGDAYQSLVDLNATKGTTAASITHIYINANIANGQTTLGKWQGAAMDTPAFWYVYDDTASAAIVPSAVTYNAVLDQYDLTGTYPTGHSLRAGTAPPTAGGLIAAGIYVATDTPNLVTIAIP